MCSPLIEEIKHDAESAIARMKTNNLSPYAALQEIEEVSYAMFCDADDDEREELADTIIDYIEGASIRNPHFKSKKSAAWRRSAKNSLCEASRLCYTHESFPGVMTAALQADATIADVADELTATIYAFNPDETMSSI